MNRRTVLASVPHAVVHLRAATVDDLAAVNAIVERAVMIWRLAERVKRLSLPSCRYYAHDFSHMQLVVAADTHGELLGVAAWDEADPRDTPAGQRGLLLHGLYVDPARHGEGVGTRLLDAAADAASAGGYDGLLVKTQVDARGFFAARGLHALPVSDPARDYPYRYWLATPRRVD